MKTAIVYYSKHHSNTKKLVDAIAQKYDVDLFNVSESPDCDLSNYDLIGFASGIYYSKFHKLVLSCAERNLPENKNVFFLYTYSALKKGYTSAIENAVKGKNAKILGSYGCTGFNTFGPFRLIGGIKKGHPDKSEIDKAVGFYEELIK